MNEWPRYKSHKEVHAARITRVEEVPDGDGAVLLHLDEGFDSYEVDGKWVRKHQPEAGGFIVRYDDGYESFSPAEPFIEGYTRL